SSTALFTGAHTVPLDTWTQLTVDYTATVTGGAQLLIDGASQPGWAVHGDFSTSAPYQRLQLWNDAVDATDFDNVAIRSREGRSPSVGSVKAGRAGRLLRPARWCCGGAPPSPVTSRRPPRRRRRTALRAARGCVRAGRGRGHGRRSPGTHPHGARPAAPWPP